MASDISESSKRLEGASIGEVVEFVKTYAKQETIGPLRGASRWIGFGAAGAIFLGVGLSFLLLGLPDRRLKILLLPPQFGYPLLNGGPLADAGLECLGCILELGRQRILELPQGCRPACHVLKLGGRLL